MGPHAKSKKREIKGNTGSNIFIIFSPLVLFIPYVSIRDNRFVLDYASKKSVKAEFLYMSRC